MAIKLASLGVELTLNAAQFVTGFESSKRAIKEFRNDVTESLAEVGRVASESFGQLGGVGGQLGEVLTSAANAATSAYSGFAKLGGVAGELAGAGAAAGAGLLVMATGTIGIAVHAAEAAAEIYRLSQSTGVSVETISGFTLAAKAVGISTEQLARSLERVDRMAYQAAITAKGTTTDFSRMGIAVTDAQGNMRPTAEIVGDIADKLQKMGPGSEATAVAMKLMGRAGADMLPFLLLGREQMERMVDVGKEMGVVIDHDMAEAAMKFKLNLSLMDAELEGVENQIARGLIPAMQELVNEIINSLISADSTLKADLDGLVSVLVFVSKAALETARAFGYLFTMMGENIRAVAAEFVIIGNSWVDAFIKLGHGDFSGFGKALGDGLKDADSEVHIWLSAQKKNFEDYTSDASKIWNASIPHTRAKPENHGGIDLSSTGTAKAFDDTLSQLKALESQTMSLLDKTQPKYKQELDKIQELIGKWEHYGTAWAQSHAGINTIVNSEIEALEKQRQKIQTNIDLLNKSLGLMQTSAGLVPSGEIPTLETAGIKPPPLPDSLLKPSIPIENLPIRSSTKELADILANRGDAAFKAEQKVLESLGLENRALVDQVQILKVLHDQGRLNDDEFALGMMRAKAALADINARTGGFADGAKAAIFDLAATWESQGDIMRRTMGEAFRGIEDNLAEMIVTGKARWGDFIKSLEVEFLKSEIHKGLATIAGTIANKLHIPGLEDLFKGKPDGTEANPLNVKVINGSGLRGGAGKEISPELLSSLRLKQSPNDLSGLPGSLNEGYPSASSGGELASGLQIGGNLASTFGSMIPGPAGAVASIAGGIAGSIGSAMKSSKTTGPANGTQSSPFHVLVDNQSSGGGGIPGPPDVSNLPLNMGPMSGISGLLAPAQGPSGDSGGGDGGGIGGAVGGAFSAVGGFFKNLFSHFGGGMADGGDMDPGKWYVTGERHPEIIAPKRPMSVYASMPRMTGTYGNDGGGGSPEFHFHGVQDADTFKRNKGQMAAWQQQTTYAAHLRHS